MLTDYTFNELVNRAIEIANGHRDHAHGSDEARDLSLSITHLEDAATRYNSSRYHRRGTWKRADPDKLDPTGTLDADAPDQP